MLILAVISFCLANFRIFVKQSKRIAELEDKLASSSTRKAEIEIVPKGRSGYVLNRNRGILIQFSLMMENRGLKNSTITDFDVSISRFGTLHKLTPCTISSPSLLGFRSINYVQNKDAINNYSTVIQIGRETTVGPGHLVFFDENFDTKKFLTVYPEMELTPGPLSCTLTVRDTNGISAACDIVLQSYEM
jgi:hypothetical protein